MNFSEIIDNLGSVINNGDKDNIIQVFSAVDKAIKNNQIEVLMDDNLHNLLNGMCCKINDSGKMNLLYSKKFLETYNQNSSIHLSILIHEFSHLFDYLNSRKAYMDPSNIMFTLMELRALHNEAEFIKYFLADKFKLSEMEEFIMQSYENDDMETVSVLLQNTSPSMFFWFLEMEGYFMDKIVNKDAIFQKIKLMGYELLDRYKKAPNINELLIQKGKYSTFIKYLSHILYLICNNSEDEVKKCLTQPDIEKTSKEIESILQANNDRYNLYINMFFFKWEQDINTRYIVSE